MRWLLLAILLAPSASAASQIHLTYDGEDYAVTFRSESTAPRVSLLNATVDADAVGGSWWRAKIPTMTAGYAIDGRNFPLAPPPAPHESTRVVLVADMGVDENAAAVARAIANESPDLVLIAGDLAYAHGDVAMWDDWFDLMEPVAARVPVMPAFGNHEHYCDTGNGSFRRCEEENARWEQHFALPDPEQRYYAFDWGPLRVTALDSEAYVDGADVRRTDPDAQEAFLRESLDEDDARWDIVMFHRPLRTTLDRNGAALPDAHAARLTPMLDDASIVFAAHVHAYERSHPTASGAIHLTSGGGGRELYDSWGANESWIASRGSFFHYVVLDVSPGAIVARTVDLQGEVRDAFELRREVPDALRPPTPATPGVVTPTPISQTTPAAPTAATANMSPPPTGGGPSPDESNGVPLPPLAALLALAVAARRTRR